MGFACPISGFAPGRYARALLVALAALWSSHAFAACDVTTPTPVTVGAGFSPSAIRAGAVPLTSTPGAFGCTSAAILSLLSGNYLKATISSGSTLTLSAGGADTVTYKLFADSAGTTELKPGITAYYINGITLNLLGLLGTSQINVPVYFKLASASIVAPGTYTGSFTIKWDWYFCSVLSAGNLCIGATDTNSKSAVVNVTLIVAAKPPTISVDPGAATWDPIDGTGNPKAIPGSKRRVLLTITNPDIVPVDANVLAVVLPTPAKMAIALDGDGTGGAVIRTTEGSTPSTLTLAYTSPSSTTDQVDFSSDNGATWTYAPVAGDAATQGNVKQIRLRPQGSMAASSSYTISVPYSVN